MARVPYYVNDALVAVLDGLGLSQEGYYTEIDGRDVFASQSDYNDAFAAARAIIDPMFDDGDPTNDEEAERYWTMLDENEDFQIIYWSTEGHFWY